MVKRLAYLSFVLAFIAATFVFGFYPAGKKLAEYASLNGRVSGEVVARVYTGRSCASQVAFGIKGQYYQTDYTGCPQVGEKVEVRYAKADPSQATADGPVRVYLVTPLWMLFLLALTGFLTLTAKEELAKLRGKK